MHQQTAIGPHLILEVQQQQQENGTSVSPSMPVVIGICQVGQVASNTTHQLQAQFKSTFSPNVLYKVVGVTIATGRAGEGELIHPTPYYLVTYIFPVFFFSFTKY